MKYFIITLFLILKITLLQSQDIEFENFAEVKNPSKVKNLSIDFYSDDFNDFLKKISSFKNLESLEIKNYENKYFPEEIKQLKISKLTISNSPEIDFSLFFKLISSITTIEKLTLDNNEIVEIPKEIELVNSLKSLEITNNEGLETENLIETIKNIKSLKELSLSLNLITNLPKNIGELKQLESLNISSNNLNDLPKELENLANLDTLNIEENVFSDQVKALNNLKNIDLKFISLDKGLSDENKLLIAKLFPNAKIEEKESKLNLPIIPIETLKKDTTIEVKFGKIKVDGVQFKALSDSYLHYARLFNNRQFDYTFDSLMFEERYLDTTYAGTSKIQDNINYNFLKIYTHYKWFNKTVKFNIAHPNNSMFFYKLFPELRSFNGMTWVYKGYLDKKEFKTKYIINKQWLDFRLFFNEGNKEFTIELKSKSGFENFIAYPLFAENSNNKNMVLMESQKQYVPLFSKYLKAFDKKKQRFHKETEKNKQTYEKARQKAIDRTWIDFQKIYMCEAEKKMSKNQWLKYYDEVIANEKKALFSSTANIKNIIRSLEIEKYRNNDFNRLLNGNYFAINCSFFNKKDEKLAITNFIVIDLQQRNFYEFIGNLGIDFQSFYVSNSNIVIIAELRNGDIGFITKEELKNINFKPSKEYKIPLNIIEKSLSTVGQLYDSLGL